MSAPMSTLAQRERETYQRVWTEIPGYRTHSPGLTQLDRFLEMSGARQGAAVLDAGCGAGAALAELRQRGYGAFGVDLTDAGLPESLVPYVTLQPLWAPLPEANYVYCCDVMEHIPTEYVMLTLTRLVEAASVGVFLSIAFRPDAFGTFVGTALHQTVKPFVWWRDRLSEVGRVVEARDCLDSGLFWVEGDR